MTKYIQNLYQSSNISGHTCCNYYVIHLSLMSGIVAWHILPWRVQEHEDHHQACKIVWPVNAGRVICCNQNHFYRITIYHKHISGWFLGVSAAGLSIITINHIDTGVMIATGTQSLLWRMWLLDTRSCDYTTCSEGQPLQFCTKKPHSHVIKHSTPQNIVITNCEAVFLKLHQHISFCWR